jgi:diguanylate cyclase (GGDEF)-like protein/PAS domain S-box-containing protein
VGNLPTLARISLGLVALTCSILIGVDLVGLVPSLPERTVQARIQLAEALAVQTAMAATGSDLEPVRELLYAAERRNDELLSVALRDQRGRVLVSSGEHAALWAPENPIGSSSTHMRVPIDRAGKRWATLELRFRPIGSDGLLARLWERPAVRILVCVAALGFFAYLLFMRRTLRHLDPSAVVPPRVQMALDVMAEGVVLLNGSEQIVMVNSAFAESVGRSGTQLVGRDVATLGWLPPEFGQLLVLPWRQTLREGEKSTGTSLALRAEKGESQRFTVNAAPVIDGWGRTKGAIVTFNSVTELERKRGQLEDTLLLLEKSKDEIRSQNEGLARMARTDPLTGAANRRAFLEVLERAVADAQATKGELSCLMADLDLFKRINDQRGHAAGDEVIQRVAAMMRVEIGEGEVVCRWGGEEFCCMLDAVDLAGAVAIAERLRRLVESPGFASVPITASFGVSSLSMGATTPLELLDQADLALYSSKRGGRNRVTCWSHELDA